MKKPTKASEEGWWKKITIGRYTVHSGKEGHGRMEKKIRGGPPNRNVYGLPGKKCCRRKERLWKGRNRLRRENQLVKLD